MWQASPPRTCRQHFRGQKNVASAMKRSILGWPLLLFSSRWRPRPRPRRRRCSGRVGRFRPPSAASSRARSSFPLPPSRGLEVGKLARVAVGARAPRPGTMRARPQGLKRKCHEGPSTLWPQGCTRGMPCLASEASKDAKVQHRQAPSLALETRPHRQHQKKKDGEE